MLSFRQRVRKSFLSLIALFHRFAIDLILKDSVVLTSSAKSSCKTSEFANLFKLLQARLS
jgi:hypothetical protein